MHKYLLLNLLVCTLGPVHHALGQPTDTPAPNDGMFLITLRPYLNEGGLTLTTQQTLDKLLKILPQFPELSIMIEVYTSNYNFRENRLESRSESQERSDAYAQKIRDYLINKGVYGNRITATGYGQSRPKQLMDKQGNALTPDDSPYTRVMNERIEIKLIPQFSDDRQHLATELGVENIAYIHR